MTTRSAKLPKRPFLRESEVIKYLFGQFWSLAGTYLQSSSLGLMIIYLLGKENGVAVCGDVIAFGYLPGFFLSGIAGIWLDTMDKRKVLMWTSSLGALQAITLAYCARGNLRFITVPEIKILAIVGGFILAVDSVNRNGIIRSLLFDRHNAQKAGAILGSLYNFSMILGGGMAALSIHYLGYSGTYIVNACGFIVLFIIMAIVKLPSATTPQSVSTVKLMLTMWSRIKDGAKYTFGEPGLRIAIILTGLFCLFGYSYNAILRVIVEEMFKGGNELYSTFMKCTGLGALLGSALVIFLGSKCPKTLIVTGGLCMGGGLVAFGHSTNIHAGMAIMFVVGYGFMSCIMTTRSAVGHIASIEYAARAQGFALMIFLGAVGMGSSALGHFAKHFGCPLTLEICGSIVIVLCIITPLLPGINEITHYKK